mgnify:CR=1 FL=1
MQKSNSAPRREPVQIEFAREQRQQANEFSRVVWEMVRARKVEQQKFRREYPYGPYTLDFVCLELHLVIEIDGKDHFTDEGRKYDARRDAYLREHGFEVLRIEGFRVIQDGPEVHDRIVQAVEQRIKQLNEISVSEGKNSV